MKKGVTLGAAQLYECPANITVGEQNDTYINGACNEPLKNTDGILFYIKLPGANLVLPDLVLESPDRWSMPYPPVLSLFEGEKCYALPLGSNRWQEMTVEKAYTSSYSGGLEFGGAFEGFIKIPYSALKNDSGFALLTDTDILEQFKKLSYGAAKSYPTFFKGDFSAEKGKDCFVHLKNFTKGFVTVNGFNIGRYWNIGPQLSLYIPWPLLKENNGIIVFEEENAAEPIIEITDKHILNGCNEYKNAEVVM